MGVVDDADFERRYGPWQPLSLTECADLLRGFGRPWWIAGGVALEAFAGVGRPHEDVDIAFFEADLPRLRVHLGARWHLWSAGSGMLRPITDDWPELHERSHQVWLREHAGAPWVADLLASPGDESAYRVRFDVDFRCPLSEATWVCEDGVRYLDPDLVLAFKARLMRPKDEVDFCACVPKLLGEQRDRLRSLLAKIDAAHPWLLRL